MLSKDYQGTIFLGSALEKYLPDTRDVRILDVGAGTGLVALKVIKFCLIVISIFENLCFS